jgi:pyruvate/2-oxoglutarate dehydrogenase complex dihydrolipoamide dehydrogenase (E3) component
MSSGNTYDLIVLGTGPAGEKAAAKAAYFGKKVAIVEKEKCFGGAGVNTGTAPSKTLKESAFIIQESMTRVSTVMIGPSTVKPPFRISSTAKTMS